MISQLRKIIAAEAWRDALFDWDDRLLEEFRREAQSKGLVLLTPPILARTQVTRALIERWQHQGLPQDMPCPWREGDWLVQIEAHTEEATHAE